VEHLILTSNRKAGKLVAALRHEAADAPEKLSRILSPSRFMDCRPTRIVDLLVVGDAASRQRQSCADSCLSLVDIRRVPHVDNHRHAGVSAGTPVIDCARAAAQASIYCFGLVPGSLQVGR